MSFATTLPFVQLPRCLVLRLVHMRLRICYNLHQTVELQSSATVAAPCYLCDQGFKENKDLNTFKLWISQSQAPDDTALTTVPMTILKHQLFCAEQFYECRNWVNEFFCRNDLRMWKGFKPREDFSTHRCRRHHLARDRRKAFFNSNLSSFSFSSFFKNKYLFWKWIVLLLGPMLYPI